jgi:hypothetical protein
MAIGQTLVHGARVVGTPLAEVVEKVVMKAPGVDAGFVKLILRDLKAGKILKPAFKDNLKRIDDLLHRLPTLAAKFQVRRGDIQHLFLADSKAVDSGKAEYRRALQELRVFARSPEFEHLLNNPATRKVVEEYARGHMMGLSGIVERYGDLIDETYACNSLTKRLYPRASIRAELIAYAKLHKLPMPSKVEIDNLAKANRLDAQHVIEKRTFEVFKKEWNMLGWGSENDMPAMAIMHEWHIPSPKNLPGMEGRMLNDDAIPIEDVFSLTKEMEARLPLKDFNTAEDYLKALKKFYAVSHTNDRGEIVQPLTNLVTVVEKLQSALAKARNNVFGKVKKLRGQ